MSKRHHMKLSEDEIDMLLDSIQSQLTDKHSKKNRKRFEAMYDLYQTVGQALGEADAVLSFTETNDD
jgi:hypothetical protein